MSPGAWWQRPGGAAVWVDADKVPDPSWWPWGSKTIEPPPVSIRYTNWRGETAWRDILPRSIHFGVTEYHPKPGWLLDAWDLDKQAERTFALSGIHEWLDASAPGEPVR